MSGGLAVCWPWIRLWTERERERERERETERDRQTDRQTAFFISGLQLS